VSVLRARDRWGAAVADRLPPTLQGRWALDRRTGMVLAVSVLIAALLIGGWAVLRSRPHELSVARGRPLGADGGAGPRAAAGDSPVAQEPRGLGLGTGAAPGPGSAGLGPGNGIGSGTGPGAGIGPAAGAGTGTGVVVDIEGRVAKPGVRTLPAGSRVIDALTAAGGALPGTDLSPLDQARVLIDGEQLLVGVSPPPGAPATAPGRGGGKGKDGKAGDGAAEPVHLNSAAVEDLEQLPGIGPALAQRVVDYRTAHGPFHSVEDLRQVSGFGGQRYQTLAPLLTL
jgi:competence protein ComEA